jgi:hypothetical protein
MTGINLRRGTYRSGQFEFHKRERRPRRVETGTHYARCGGWLADHRPPHRKGVRYAASIRADSMPSCFTHKELTDRILDLMR